MESVSTEGGGGGGARCLVGEFRSAAWAGVVELFWGWHC